jgi:hypothetical protein
MTDVKILPVEFSFEPHIHLKADQVKIGGIDGLKAAQSFFCDFLPVAAAFIFELNSSRAKLHELKSDLDKISANVEDVLAQVAICDERLAKSYSKGADWLAGRAYELINAGNNSDTTRSVNIFSFFLNSDGNLTAQRIASYGPRKELKEIDVASHTLLATIKAARGKDDVVGPYYVDNIPDTYRNNQYFHPSLQPRENRGAAIFDKQYVKFLNRISVWRKRQLKAAVETQWNSLWTQGVKALGSSCVFPVTVANNSLSAEFESHFFGDSTGLHKAEVFSAITFDSSDLHSFSEYDRLFGKIVADCFFVFDGAAAHYKYTSELRKSFDRSVI